MFTILSTLFLIATLLSIVTVVASSILTLYSKLTHGGYSKLSVKPVMLDELLKYANYAFWIATGFILIAYFLFSAKALKHEAIMPSDFISAKLGSAAALWAITAFVTIVLQLIISAAKSTDVVYSLKHAIKNSVSYSITYFVLAFLFQ